jgi:pyrrolidone-carboxylate peptidase
MKKKVLIYAFGSWEKVSRNVSEEVLNRLMLDVDKRVLRVHFEIDPYREIAIGDYDLIIGIGQYPRGKSIRLEQFTYNIYGTKIGGYKAIDKMGPDKIELDLKIAVNDDIVLTDDPGRFVCNFSMYQLMRLKDVRTKLAFVHIPKDMKVELAVDIVMRLLKSVGVQ